MNPNCVSLKSAPAPVSRSLSRSLFVWNPKIEPVNVFVPVFVTALIRPPVKPEWRTSNGAVKIWNSWMASSEIAFAPA